MRKFKGRPCRFAVPGPAESADPSDRSSRRGRPRPTIPGMESRLHLDIAPQPDNNTCGPTCLHAIYNYYGDPISLPQIISETPALEEGGTLAVLLGCHALSRGYSVVLYTYNLTVFDPTWFQPGGPPIADRLRAQMAAKDIPKLRLASQAYLEFLRLGGVLRISRKHQYWQSLQAKQVL